MRRLQIIATLGCLLVTVTASAQDVGMPGVMYSGSIAAGEGGQLYPYDRQDPWLHGQYQRVPAYGGFARFRPYNYRHVFAQSQISTNVWGSPHGMPYSQQFWNRYRQDYLNGKLHSDMGPVPVYPQAHQSEYAPQNYAPQNYGPVNPISYQTEAQEVAVPLTGATAPAPVIPSAGTPAPTTDTRPVHVFPAATTTRR
jgi:hypothetical protein